MLGERTPFSIFASNGTDSVSWPSLRQALVAEDALDVLSPEGANPLVATFRRTVTGQHGTFVLAGDATLDLADKVYPV